MNVVLILLLALALGTSVVILGGAGILVYAMPGYCVLGLTAVLALTVLRKHNLRAGSGACLSSLLLGGYIAARAWLSPSPYQAQMDLFMVLAALAVYLLTAQYLTHPRHRSIVIGTLLLLVVVQSGIAILQFKGGENFMLIPWLPRPDYDWRASGFYGCPNHLAGFLEISILFGLSMVLWSRWPAWLKLLTVWVCLLGTAVQLMTGSRGGYLSLGFGLAVLAIASLAVVRKVSPHRFWISLVALVVSASILTGGVMLFARHSQLLNSRIGNVVDKENMRLKLWQGAWEQAQLSPAVGTGAGTYLFYGRKFLPSDLRNDPIYVHNDYLHLLAEYGAIGVLVLALFIGTHLVCGLSQIRWISLERMAHAGRSQSTALALTVGSIAAVGALLVHSVVDFNFHIPANTLIMAFVFGLLANAGVRTENDRASARALALFSKILVPVLGVALLWLSVPRLQSEKSTEIARRALDSEQFGLAMQSALDALSYRQDDPNTYYYLGWAQFKISRQQKSSLAARIIARNAAETLGKGVQLMPQDTRLLVAYAHVLRRSGQYDQADHWYQEALKWDPNSADIHARYGMMLAETGKPDQARAQFEKAQTRFGSALAQRGLQKLDTDAAAKAEAARQPAAEPVQAPPEVLAPLPEPISEEDREPILPLSIPRGF